MNEEQLLSLQENLRKNNVLVEKTLKALEENSECKNKLEKEIKNKFFEQFISIVDRMINNKINSNLSIEFKIEDLYEEIDDFLEDNEIEYFIPNTGEIFDRKIHQAIEKIETDNSELDKTIAQSMSYGFKFDGLVIKPSKVSVYKFINKENK